MLVDLLTYEAFLWMLCTYGYACPRKFQIERKQLSPKSASEIQSEEERRGAPFCRMLLEFKSLFSPSEWLLTLGTAQFKVSTVLLEIPVGVMWTYFIRSNDVLQIIVFYRYWDQSFLPTVVILKW